MDQFNLQKYSFMNVICFFQHKISVDLHLDWRCDWFVSANVSGSSKIILFSVDEIVWSTQMYKYNKIMNCDNTNFNGLANNIFQPFLQNIFCYLLYSKQFYCSIAVILFSAKFRFIFFLGCHIYFMLALIFYANMWLYNIRITNTVLWTISIINKLWINWHFSFNLSNRIVLLFFPFLQWFK